SLPSLGGTTRCALPFAATTARRDDGGPGGIRVRRPPRTPSDPVETTGSPKFPGDPQCLFAHVLRPRQDGTPLTVAVRQCGPREGNNEGSCIGTFEAQEHGFEARCLRFVGRVTPPPRQTRFQVLVRRS